MSRGVRLAFEPLIDWPYPRVVRERSRFSARWPQTRDLLLREADMLGARLVVVELDLGRTDLRRDGEIRASARLTSGKVRVSADTRHGPMRFACDRYDAGVLSWQANARAVALTMEALRTVDRYGAARDGQQYQGFLAIEQAPPGDGEFATAEEALRWLWAKTGDESRVATPRAAYRAAAHAMHPDVGGARGDWDTLQHAERLMREAGLM